jgi:AcrR family transcriptional regulator
VAAALAEFTEKGYEAATVTDIAERAGVTTGALYAHFDGKLALLLPALGITPASEMMKDLAEVAAQPRPEVAHLFSENISAVPDDATLLLLDAVVAARRDRRVADALRAGFAAYEEEITRAAEAGMALGLIAPAVPPRQLVRVLTLISLGRLVIAALDADPPSEAVLGRVAELLLRSDAPAGGDGADDALERVRSRARDLERARDELAESVAAANDGGHSLRALGAAAGVSHERIRQMLRDKA